MLQPDPRHDATVRGARPLAEHALVVVEGVEVVEVGVFADVVDGDDAVAERLCRPRGTVHVAPHVDDRRGARQQSFGVAEPRGGLGLFRPEHAVHGVDVQAQPLPDGQVLGRPAQHPGVVVCVDETRHHQAVGQIDDLGVGVTGPQVRRVRRPR